MLIILKDLERTRNIHPLDRNEEADEVLCRHKKIANIDKTGHTEKERNNPCFPGFLILVLRLGVLRLHEVESRTGLEPVDLVLVEGVSERDGEGSVTVGGGNIKGDARSRGKRLDTAESNGIVSSDLVVVSGVHESEREHTLLLEVGLMDTSETLDNDGGTSEVTGLKSSVLTRRTLTIVIISDNNPRDTSSLVLTGDIGNSTELTSDLVLNLVDGVVLGVDSSDEEVVRDVVEVTTELEPGTSHGDVIGCALALGLDEDLGASDVFTVPSSEGGEELKTSRLGADLDLDGGTILRGVLVGILTGIKVVGREGVSVGGGELEVLAIRGLERVGDGVESHIIGEDHGSDKFGGGDESVSSGVSIVTLGKVTVVRSDNRVSLSLGDVLTIPLSNTGSTGVGEDGSSNLVEDLHLSVTLDSGTNLLGTGGDVERNLGLDTSIKGLLTETGATLHVFVRRVGTRSDETGGEVLGPFVLGDGGLEVLDGGAEIGGEGSVQLRLELIEVDLNHLIVVSTLIRDEVALVLVGEVGDAGTLGGNEVLSHALVVGEDGGGGSNLSSHVTDGGHTGTRDGFTSISEVLNNGAGTSLDGEDTSELQDNILGGGPSMELSSELNSNNLGGLELPRESSHHIDGIGTTDTNGSHTKTTSVGGVRVSSDHKTSGEGVVLNDNLVNDTRTGLPETHAVLGTSSREELVDLLVSLLGAVKISDTFLLGLDEVITVDSGGDSGLGEARGNELKHSHLGGGILHGNAIGAELEVSLTTNNVGGRVGVVEVTINDLLGEGKRALDVLANGVKALVNLLVRQRGAGLEVAHGHRASMTHMLGLQPTHSVEGRSHTAKRTRRMNG